MQKLWIVPAIAFALAGCGSDKDSGDTGGAAGTTTTTTTSGTTSGTGGGTTYTGPLLIDVFAPPACADDTNWIYYAETLGYTNGNNIMNAWETGANRPYQWNEEHDLPSIDALPNNERDFLSLTLTDEASVGSYAPNSNTLYRCGYHDALTTASNTYLLRVYDVETGGMADCMWGVDPNAPATSIDDVVAGEVDEPNAVSGSGEISASCGSMNF